MVISIILRNFALAKQKQMTMTKEILLQRIMNAIKYNGVGGIYIFIQDGVQLSDGTIINEVRLSKNHTKVEFIEQYSNKAITRLKTKDVMKVYNAI